LLRKSPKRRRAAKAVRPARRRAAPITIAHHSIGYIVTVIGEVLRSTSLDVLDVLIIMAVSSASVSHTRTTTSPKRRTAHGVSRNAVSRSLNVPLETVRRRVSLLLKKKIIQERADGLIVAPVTPLGALQNTAELLALNARTVRQMFLDLKAQGVRLD
jgi:hypothetical protein